jgi:energy-coupling factor transporter ATP-binding protein EcfA2
VKARDNPFESSRVLSAIRYEGPDGTAGGARSLLPRLEALGYRAAITGPHGSGKTTLLEDLEAALAARGFRIAHVRLDSEDRRLPRGWGKTSARLEARDVVCLDGAEQLDSLRWLWFRWTTRRAGGLIVTAHREGRLPTLIVCATSVDLLDRIIHRLAPSAAAGAPGAAELFVRHRGNVREALRELYDVYAMT